MKKQLIFKGVGTALITPFKDGKIDYIALKKIIDAQLEAEIDAIIVGGTTGEVATLDDNERYTLYREARDIIDKKSKLILGVGTNDTKNAVRHTEMAEKIGCDGLLCVTPYYNKGTESGITQHYKAIAKSTSLPIILYNVPSRTGVNLSSGAVEELIKCENVVGIKEASDSFTRFAALAEYKDELWLYSGEDSLIYPTLAIGGVGVISVASNALPKEIRAISEAFFKGDSDLALKLQKKYKPFMKALFCETNPAPIKAVMSELYGTKNELRLPMSSVSERNKRLVLDELKAIM